MKIKSGFNFKECLLEDFFILKVVFNVAMVHSGVKICS